jgi:UDP-glucose 4-epimerase
MLTHLNKSPTDPSRVVLVGASGFVGKALRESLAAAGAKVVLVGRPSFDLLESASVASLSSLWGPGDAVVVTAALTPDKGRDTATLIRNLRMAEHLAAAIAIRPCAHVVYFSSDAVYDSSRSDVSEATPAAPGDLYGVMHLARELALGEAAAKAAIPFCILRPCAIYGAGDTHNSYGPNRFIRTALSEGRIRIFGAGEETRDHVYIDDVCGLARLALLHKSAGTLNLVSGQAVTFGWIAAEVARLAGIPVAIEQLPRSGAPTHRRFDAAAIAGSFPGHRPTPIAVGLPQTIAAVRQAGKPAG